ncbi:LysR family transcriptional regulator [Acidocella sp.]|uniref:LysR family transcriptional regulator n=1 Tax=Acidocella sp. TaxID=50710 RepID=UPI003D07AA4D
MELRALRCFEILAEELHFARAAARLGLAQSGVSRLIADLETDLGGALFNRGKRSQVSLTTTGALFLPEAQAILRQAERGESLGKRAARGEVGRLEIGFVASAAWDGTASALVGRYHEAAPGVEIHLREMETPRQLEEIAAGRLDMGFLRARADYPVEVRVTALKRDALLLALPAHSHLAQAPALTPEMLKGQKFILPHFGEEAGFLARLRSLGEAGGFTPEFLTPVRDFITVLTAVGAGLGLGLIPEPAKSLGLPGVVLRPIGGIALQSELMLASRRAETSPAVRQFLALARMKG